MPDKNELITKEKESQSLNDNPSSQSSKTPQSQIVDNSEEAIQMRSMMQMGDNSDEALEVLALQSSIDNSPSPSLPKYEEDETNPYDNLSLTGLTDQQKEDFIQVRELKAKNFKDANDDTLQGLANALFQYPDNITTLKDTYLVHILKTTFESNWFKAKKCLTTDFWPGVTGSRPTHEASISLMQALVDMRGRIWDTFVKEVQPKIKGEVAAVEESGGIMDTLSNPDKLDDNFGLKEAVGSESVTSDIDLSAKGENTEIGVKMINAEFRKIYQTEPGAFFDINVYSSDWMFGATEKTEGTTLHKTPITESKTLTNRELTAEGQKKKDATNEVWSMVKIRRNMEDEDWSEYKRILLEGLQSEEDAAKRAEMESQFAKVDQEHTTFKNTVAREVANLKRGINYEEQQQKSAFKDEGGKDHYADDAMEMAVSNRKYEEIILQVKATRLLIKKLEADNASREEVEGWLLAVHDLVARGLTYANEVYATEGAVLHTVYGGQGARKEEAKLAKIPGNTITKVEYHLTKEQYLQAVNENVGDSLHSIKHNQDDPQYAVYRAGKYLARLSDAATQLISDTEVKKIAGYKDINEIGAASIREKGGDAGKDPLAVRNPKSFFSQYEKSYLSTLKSTTIAFGAKTAAKYKKDKK